MEEEKAEARHSLHCCAFSTNTFHLGYSDFCRTWIQLKVSGIMISPSVNDKGWFLSAEEGHPSIISFSRK